MLRRSVHVSGIKKCSPSPSFVFATSLAQSGVDDSFRMLVPVYLELGDGRVANLGRITILGNSSEAIKVPLNGITKIRRAGLWSTITTMCSRRRTDHIR